MALVLMLTLWAPGLLSVDVLLFINCKLNTTTEATEALCAT